VTNTENKLYKSLKNRSLKNIIWKLNISSKETKELFSKAKAFLFPPEEDFGLVPIEAMISGTPVVAFGK
jgi:glycosyltransferase involved in cell wall biosynthesis